MKLNFSKDEFLNLLHLNLCACYQFNPDQLNKYKELLDWREISANTSIKWNYKMVKEFEFYLHWETLKVNKKVNQVMTLGLLFPDRVELPKCHCSFQYDFCECDNRNWHNGDWEKGLVKGDGFLPRGTGQHWVIQNIVNSIDEVMLEDILLRDYIDNNLLVQNNINLID